MRRNRFVITLVLSFLCVVVITSLVKRSFAQKTSVALPKVLADGSGAESRRVDNMHLVRYIEIFLAAREANGKLVAACFNTTFNPTGHSRF